MEYILGIDLCRDITQLCVFNTETGAVDSVPLSSDKQSTRVKTAMTYSEEQNDWLIYSPLHEGRPGMTVVDNLYDILLTGEAVRIGNEVFEPKKIFARFLRRLVFSMNRDCESRDIKGIAVTVKKIVPELKKNIEEGLEYYGITSDRYRICDHIESFMYYVVMQNKDIWINDVGLFDFNEEEFKFYMLHFGRKQKPLSILADSTDFSSTVKYEMLSEEDDIRIKYAFENVCGIMLHKQTVSAVYATGTGFEGTWADDILKKISTGRRIFRGLNLYVKGAAYVAKLFFIGGKEEFLVIGEDDLKSNMSLRAISHSEQTEVPFGKVGQKYYEAGGSVEVILDSTNEIDFMLHNALKKDSFFAIMTLDALPVRKNKTTRVSVSVRFPSRNEAVVTVKDEGFGAVRPTDYRIWEQVINL